MDGAAIFFSRFFLILRSADCVFCVYACWDCHKARKQAKVRAAKDAEEKPRRAAEKAREEEQKRIAEAAAAVAAAMELSTAVGRRRIEVSTRLARDAVQSAMASPIHTALVAPLSQQGQVREVAARYTQLVESAISRALVDCELDEDCRLLSLMAPFAASGSACAGCPALSH
jgi:hypothetical protein